ncbi:hypothetical protein C7476_103278 [Phyllobacterium bourgognense]|uniref:Uncharacterized protein n=1 Tax=Phyllobacterium bourgognense TaxID=314236 RepID=A0A368YZ08_9HYPH|nr:hypothetical protein C7476_103278 [Phyllobacterium bourgognense]
MKPSMSHPTTFTPTQTAAEMNGIHITATTKSSSGGSRLPECRYAYQAGYSSNEISEIRVTPSMRWSLADGLLAIHRKSAAATTKNEEKANIAKKNISRAPPNPLGSGNAHATRSPNGLSKTILYRTPDVSPLATSQTKNITGPVKQAAISTARRVLESTANLPLPTLGLPYSTLHIRRGASIEFYAIEGTGAGSTSQETPEITFSETPPRKAIL